VRLPRCWLCGAPPVPPCPPLSWCIFELAIASRELGPTRITLQPLWLPPFMLAVSLSSVAAVVIAFAIERSGLYLALLRTYHTLGMAFLWVIVGALPSLGICAVLRVKVLSHERLMRQVATFSLAHARVTVESDRAIVHAELRSLFGSTDAFEDYVRNELHEHVRAAIGAPYAIPYGWMAFMFLPYAWLGVVDSVSLPLSVVGELPAEHKMGAQDYAVSSLVYYVGFAFLVCPLAMQLTCLITYAGRKLPFVVGWLLDMCVLHMLVYVFALLDSESIGRPALMELVMLINNFSPGVEFAMGWSPVASSLVPLGATTRS